MSAMTICARVEAVIAAVAVEGGSRSAQCPEAAVLGETSGAETRTSCRS